MMLGSKVWKTLLCSGSRIVMVVNDHTSFSLAEYTPRSIPNGTRTNPSNPQKIHVIGTSASASPA